MPPDQPSHPFPIIEILIAAVIVLAIAVGVVFFGMEKRRLSADLRCQHQLEQIGMAMMMYSSANRGAWPPARDPRSGHCWADLLAASFLDTTEVLVCPLSRPPRGAHNPCTYGYNGAVASHPGAPGADTIVLLDYDRVVVDPAAPGKYVAGRHRGKAFAALGDGSVRGLMPAAIKAGGWTPVPGD